MDDERRSLVEAYWRIDRNPDGERQRSTAEDDEDWWSVEAVADAIEEWRSDDVVGLLEDLLISPNADAIFVGAGPLEDLLAERPDLSAQVAERCRRSEVADRWREACSTVVWDERHLAALEPLRPWLPLPEV